MDVGGAIKGVDWDGVTGVVAVGAFVDAILFGGLGRDGKNSDDPLGSTVPLVGDPKRKKKAKS